MGEAVDNYVKKREQVAATNKQIQIAKTLMETLNLTEEQVMAAMRIPEQERAAMLKRL